MITLTRLSKKSVAVQFAAVFADEAHAPEQPMVDGLPVEHAVLQRFRHELDQIICP